MKKLIIVTLLFTFVASCVSSELNSLPNKIVVMHPGPINRGVEITSDVADSDQSIILDQVENGVAIRMAVIYLLAEKIKREA